MSLAIGMKVKWPGRQLKLKTCESNHSKSEEIKDNRNRAARRGNKDRSQTRRSNRSKRRLGRRLHVADLSSRGTQRPSVHRPQRQRNSTLDLHDGILLETMNLAQRESDERDRRNSRAPDEDNRTGRCINSTTFFASSTFVAYYG